LFAILNLTKSEERETQCFHVG
jgi:hypothetical protein